MRSGPHFRRLVISRMQACKQQAAPHTRMHTCMQAYTCVHTCARTHSQAPPPHTHTHICIHTHTRTCTRTYTHTHNNAQVSQPLHPSSHQAAGVQRAATSNGGQGPTPLLLQQQQLARRAAGNNPSPASRALQFASSDSLRRVSMAADASEGLATVTAAVVPHAARRVGLMPRSAPSSAAEALAAADSSGASTGAVSPRSPASITGMTHAWGNPAFESTDAVIKVQHGAAAAVAAAHQLE